MSGPDWYRWYPSKWLSGTLGLTNEQRGVYVQIVNVILDRGECPTDENYLMTICNLRRRPLRRILRELVEQGKITQNGANFEQTRAKLERNLAETLTKHQRNRAAKRWESNGLDHTTARATNNQTQNHKEELESRTDSESYQENQRHTLNNRSASRARAREADRPNGLSADADGEFIFWWSLWSIPGTKRGRGQALKAYRTARKTVSAEILVNGLRKHVDRWQREETEPQYIPYPATWLNGQRWADDLAGRAEPQTDFGKFGL